jgi:hypothetical protein
MSNYTRSKIYYSESNADGTQTGSTQITQTTDSGEYNFQPLQIFAQVTQEQNVLTPAVVSVGTNDPDYNNLVSAKSIGGAVGMVPLQIEGDLPKIGAEVDIKVKVNTACLPVVLTTPTLEFKIILSGLEM